MHQERFSTEETAVRKTTRLLASIVLGLLLAATAAVAIPPEDVIELESYATPGGNVRIALKHEQPNVILVPGPKPDDPVTSIGPVDSDGRKAIGGALASPRGGSVLSPKQKADRDIRKLIRSLG